MNVQADSKASPKADVALAALSVAAAFWVVYLFSRYWWIFGGDPEIHITFARNLLAGHFLEFNPGYKTGGETSPLYMLIVAGGYTILGAYLPYGMKALGYVCFAVISYLLFQANDSASLSRRWCYVLLVASMPFFIFQASLGMENMLFAAVVVGIVHVVYQPIDRRLTQALPALVPVLFFLRPEAVFIALWLGCLALAERKIASVVAVAVSLAITYALYTALNHYTGVETHNAGMIRAYLSTVAALRIPFAGHDVFVSLKVLVGTAYALPLLAYMGINRKALTSRDLVTLGTLFVVPALLHLFSVLPNTQFSRYFLFEYGVLLYVFAFRFLGSIDSRVMAGLWLVTLLIAFAELHQRAAGPEFSVEESVRERSPAAVEAYSDALLKALHPNELPVSIATQEVQLRARLDDRFVIWSLDGITDFKLEHHLQNGYIDHFGYIRDRHIEFIQGLPDYNRDKSKPSLAAFGRAVVPPPCIEGLRLEPTPVDNMFRVVACGG